MRAGTMIKIHNKFEIVPRNAETLKVQGEIGYAENIVLDRCYTQLLNFNPYFTNIVFGTGTGTLSASRTTLFNRIGNKAAVTEELIRAYPTSKWTGKTTLGTEEFNGYRFTEVGISETSTNINTHALIKDAEGNPLMMEEKTNLIIVDIYATVFIEIYNVDTGLYWYSNGLRNYLTGGSSVSNILGISNLREAEIATITGARTIDSVNRTVKVAGRFNVGDFNQDVRFLYWTGAGLMCEVPRPGVFEGRQINDLQIGVGDGTNKKFSLKRNPNTPIENLAVKVDDVLVDFSYHPINIVTLDVAPSVGAIVKASYKSMYYPKAIDNVIDVDFKIGYALGQPAPVVPPPTPQIGVIPGATTPIGGDLTYGFFGEVTSDDLITGNALANEIGLTAGISQHSVVPWLKFALDGKILFVAKRTFRHTISWNDINAVNAVYGGKTVIINGLTYKVRLLKTGLVDPMPGYDGVNNHGSEWNKLMLPIHIRAKDKSWAYPANVESDVPYWGIDYTDKDLLTHTSFGNGSYSWCQETWSSFRVVRGYDGVSDSHYNSPSYAGYYIGWRPVLELVA